MPKCLLLGACHLFPSNVWVTSLSSGHTSLPSSFNNLSDHGITQILKSKDPVESPTRKMTKNMRLNFYEVTIFSSIVDISI